MDNQSNRPPESAPPLGAGGSAGRGVALPHPAGTLLARLRADLAAEFDPSRPTRISQAPGRLDVMGGIADYTGSMVCEATIDRATAVALQARTDRDLQIFSFDLLDAHQPFTLRIPLDALGWNSAEALAANSTRPVASGPRMSRGACTSFMPSG